MIARYLFFLLLILSSSLVFAGTWDDAVVTTIAGVPGIAGFHDGPAREATFDRPTWLDIAEGNDCSAPAGEIYVVDRRNDAIRRISNGVVTTYTVNSLSLDSSLITFDFGDLLGGGMVMEPLGGGCGCGPYDRGFFVSSSATHEIMLISRVGFLASRDGLQIFGTRGMPGHNDGPPPSARFNNPTGVARSWFYSRGDLNKRRLYVADTGNHTIRSIDFTLSFEACPIARNMTTLAGIAGSPGTDDGPAATARFNTPRGVAAGPDGSVYVADSGNHTIRKITPAGEVVTIAGVPGVFGANDGPALEAHLNTPSGIDVNADGEVFIADTGNNAIRMLTTDGMLVTIAGALREWGTKDGAALDARFTTPVGIRLTSNGDIIVADTSNNLIRRITRSAK